MTSKRTPSLITDTDKHGNDHGKLEPSDARCTVFVRGRSGMSLKKDQTWFDCIKNKAV